MTKKDVDNLTAILKSLREINFMNVEDIAKKTGLNITLVLNLLPVLITRKCIKEGPQLTSFDYSIDTMGKAYLIEETFQKEYENELKEKDRHDKEIKLLRWRIRTYWIHWAITILAFGMSAYLFITKFLK